MNPAQHVIAKLGGFAAVAKITGVHVSRVHRWTYTRESGGTGGVIPSRHQQPMLDFARESGVNLKPADFFEPTPAEAKAKNKAEAA